MLVVKQISTGKIVHRESPDFAKGMGILNASRLNGIPVEDLEEVDVTEQEWDASLPPIIITEEDLQTQLANAKNVTEKINIIAKYLGAN